VIRDPAVAGMFYPADPDELRRMIDRMLDRGVVREDAVAAVLPHAGYVYSGPAAAAVLSRMKLKKTAVIIGPNHTGVGAEFSIITEGAFRTPLGEAKINTALARAILGGSTSLEEDSEAQVSEHSIEVQIPFLQVIDEGIEIVPIVLSPSRRPVFAEIGREIARAIRKTGNEAVLIASSDMTHYESREIAEEKDRYAIEAILKLDGEELKRRISRRNITMCGWIAAVSVIAAARELGAKKGELVSYRTSGETSGDFCSVVGYAGIMLK
jgi:AmmeMemoRadiSam system protein B